MKWIVSSVLLVVLSFCSLIAEDLGWKDRQVGAIVFYALRYLPLALIVAGSIVATLWLIVRYMADGSLVFRKIEMHAYYADGFQYDLVQYYHCRNEGSHPLREIFHIKEGYYEEPQGEPSANAVVLLDEVGRQIHLNASGQRVHDHVSGDRQVTTYRYDWIARLDPVLSPGESVQFKVIISSRGVERSVYENHGSTFSWSVDEPTRELVMVVHAPPGKSIMILGSSVNDEVGGRLKRELSRIGYPILAYEGTMVTWRILLPKKKCRYAIRYRIVG